MIYVKISLSSIDLFAIPCGTLKQVPSKIRQWNIGFVFTMNDDRLLLTLFSSLYKCLDGDILLNTSEQVKLQAATNALFLGWTLQSTRALNCFLACVPRISFHAGWARQGLYTKTFLIPIPICLFDLRSNRSLRWKVPN